MKQLHIRPRQSGKTTWLVNMFKKDILGSYFICLNCEHRNKILNNYFNQKGSSLYYSSDPVQCHVITVDQLRFNNINIFNKPLFIDEYFLNKNREWLTRYLIGNNLNFIAISTSDKLYNLQDVEYIQAWRENYNGLRDLNKMLKTEEQMIKEFGSEVFYNLLSYNEVEVIPWDDYRLSAWPKEQYETEVLGKYFE